jgi:tape measure domain-containing protein
MDLGTMVVTYSGDVGQFISASNQAKSAISGVADSAQSSGSGILGGFGKAISGAVGFASSVGQTIIGVKAFASTAIDLGSALLQPAADAERTTNSFETLLHSTTAAKNEMMDLNRFAAGTPLQTQWVDGAAEKILAFGGKVGDVQPEITAIGDSLSGLGKLSEASLNSIVDIFGKISAQGKITGGDMMQLSTWGIPAWNELASAMHKPVPELQKMVSAGLVPAGVAIADLQKGMEKTFGGDMQKQANSFTGIVSTLQSDWKMALAAIGGPALKVAEQGLSQIVGVLSAPAFQTFASGVGQQIANVFSEIGGFAKGAQPFLSGVGTLFHGMADNWSEFASEFDSSDITANFKNLQQAVGNFGQQIGPLLGPLLNNADNFLISIGGLLGSLVSPALGTASQNVNGMAGAMKPMVLGLSDVFTGLQQLTTNITPAVSGIAKFVTQSNIIPITFNLIGSAFETVSPLVTGLANGLANLAGFFTQNEVAGDLLKGTLVGIGVVMAADALSGVMDLIAVFPIMIGLTWMWVSGLAAAAAGTIAATWPILAIGAIIAIVVGGIILAVQHWAQISQWFGGIWKTVSGGIGNAFSAIGSKAHDATNGIGNAFSNLGTSMHDKGKDIVQTVQNIGQGAVDAGKWMYAHNTYWKFAVDAITADVTGVKNWLVGTWTTVTTWIGNEWLQWSNLAKVYFTMIEFVIEQKIFQIVSTITNKWTQIHNWITDKWNGLKGIAQGAWDGVVSVFDSIWDRISSPLTTASNNTQSWFENLASDAEQWGANIIQGVINGIGSMFSALGSAASNAASVVTNFLGFHSPAKMGPGKELDVWGPNLVKGFASGIDRSAPILTASVNHLMSVGTYPIRPSATAVASSVAIRGSSGSGNSGNNTYIFEVDGQQLAKITQPHVDGLVRLKMGPRGRVA